MSDDQTTADASLAAFTSSLIFNSIVGVGVFAGFCVVRYWSKKIYQPRTYLVQEDIRSPELPTGAFSWVTASMRVQDTELLNRVGLDAYMFIRFHRMSAILFTGFTLTAVPILIPLNLVGGKDTVADKGLIALTFGNVTEPWRLWFHLVLTVVFAGATMYLLWKELEEYVRRRHAYLLSAKHGKTPQATTILVTAIPDGLKNREALFDIFNKFPGGVKKIWVNRDPMNLQSLIQERETIVGNLEMAEYNYARSAYGKKAIKAEKTGKEQLQPVRPVGRASAIPFKGEKVDMIDHWTEKLEELNTQIRNIQASRNVKFMNSAFIQFHSQFAAHSAVQTVVHPTPFKMAPMFVEVSPLDVVWENMNLDSWVRKVRKGISFTLVTALVLLWSFPVLFVTSIASLSKLIELIPFLSFLDSMPTSIKGIIQGILPPLFLAILMAVLPIILTILSTYEGHVRYSSITYAVNAKYFFFLVVNVMLLSTLSGGIPRVWNEFKAQGPQSLINSMATTLPGVSTFFISYVLLRGLTGPPLELLQIAPLVLNFLFTKLLAKSPRQIWNLQGRLPSLNFGSVFPQQTLMFCIGILYSTMAPLILPFVAFFFIMYWLVYRHQFLYVYHQPIETGGLAFPQAVKQTFTGVFIFEITMFGLYLLKLPNTVGHAVLAQMIILVLLIVATALVLVNLNEAFDPLITFLPVAMFSKELRVGSDGAVTQGDERPNSPSTFGQEERGSIEKYNNEDQQHREAEAYKLQDLRHRQQATLQPRTLDSDGATISSKLPAIPTPKDHQSEVEVDTMSLARRHHNQSPDSFLGADEPTAASHAAAKQELLAQERESLDQQILIQKQKQSLQVDGEDRDNNLHQRSDSLQASVSNGGGGSGWNANILKTGLKKGVKGLGGIAGGIAEIGGVGKYIPGAIKDHLLMDKDGVQVLEDDDIATTSFENLANQAFFNPVFYKTQTPVWLPVDAKGLIEEEVEKLKAKGIIVSTDGAQLDAKTAKAMVGGIVFAPGEERQYRLERGE